MPPRTYVALCRSARVVCALRGHSRWSSQDTHACLEAWRTDTLSFPRAAPCALHPPRCRLNPRPRLQLMYSEKVPSVPRKLCALKVYSKAFVHAEDMVQCVRIERDMLTMLAACPFIVRLYSSRMDHNNLVLALEMLQGGELAAFIDRKAKSTDTHKTLGYGFAFPADWVRYYTAAMLCGLASVHRTGGIYRDLKPENVLLAADGSPRMVDFGFSRFLKEGERATTLAGSLEYLAPEMCREESYGVGVDWWCLGIFVYKMATGKTPFWHRDDAGVRKNIADYVKGDFKIEFIKGWDPALRALVLMLLDPSMEVRNAMTPSKVASHPFFRGFEWRRLLAGELKPPYVPVLDDEEDLTYINTSYIEHMQEQVERLTSQDPSPEAVAAFADF